MLDKMNREKKEEIYESKLRFSLISLMNSVRH